MFDASARVPLLFRMPGVIPAGRKCNELINHVDLFPTLANLTGASSGLPSNLTGKNFAQAVLGKGKGRDISFSVHGVRAWNQPPQQVMARSDRWKFNWYPYAEQERDRYVLYDMRNDPDEITNLAGWPEHKSVVAEHKQAIDHFLASLKKYEYEPRPMQKEKKHVPAGTEGGGRKQRRNRKAA
jgi:arylsulfatase A-like enzyme